MTAATFFMMMTGHFFFFLLLNSLEENEPLRVGVSRLHHSARWRRFGGRVNSLSPAAGAEQERASRKGRQRTRQRFDEWQQRGEWRRIRTAERQDDGADQSGILQHRRRIFHPPSASPAPTPPDFVTRTLRSQRRRAKQSGFFGGQRRHPNLSKVAAQYVN